MNLDTNSKESSPIQQTNNHTVENGVVVVPTNPAIVAAAQKQQQNNNNKGESAINARRGKSNSESKAQAARNKHKNSQNKEKHSSTSSGTRRSESNSNINQNGQKESLDSMTVATAEQLVQKLKLKSEQCVQNNNKTAIKLTQQVQELKINGIVLNGDQDSDELQLQRQREGGTPASTISSSEDSSSIISTSNQQVERLLEANCEESIGNSTLVLLGEFCIPIIVTLMALAVYCCWCWYN